MGTNATIAELKWGKDCSNTSCFFIHKEYYNNSTLGGSGGMLPQEMFNSTTSETVSGGFSALGWGEACQ